MAVVTEPTDSHIYAFTSVYSISMLVYIPLLVLGIVRVCGSGCMYIHEKLYRKQNGQTI